MERLKFGERLPEVIYFPGSQLGPDSSQSGNWELTAVDIIEMSVFASLCGCDVNILQCFGVCADLVA